MEIAIEALLSPATGFEEKNNVQAVLYGRLPNGCYTVGDTTVERNDTTRIILVRQYAIHETEGVCADEETMPDHMKMTIPFTNEVAIGNLPAGVYRYQFNKVGEGLTLRTLTVSRNITPNVDTLPYAAVTSVSAPDVMNGVDHLVVTISGILNSTCTTLDDHVRVLNEDDVLVLLPTVQVQKNVLCAQMLIPFEKKMDLGTTYPGVHLIHTRSMNGRAVNKVVVVSK
ncbi:MAG: hypothetical protein ACXWPM_05545 [Bdellovibrionota bacterium]